MDAVTLYQFELCPFCNKVRAGLELKNIAYKKVEVNNFGKKEIAHIEPGPSGRKKVPILEWGDEVVHDSSAILGRLDGLSPEGGALLPSEPDLRERAEMIDTWVDEELTQILPTVIYGTWRDSFRAAMLMATTSNFSLLDRLKLRLFGAVVMKFIARRILKKRGNGRSAPELLKIELDRLEEWLGEQSFLCGDRPTLADAAAQGALSCVRELRAFDSVRQRPKLNAWFERVDGVRRDPAF